MEEELKTFEDVFNMIDDLYLLLDQPQLNDKEKELIKHLYKIQF